MKVLDKNNRNQYKKFNKNYSYNSMNKYTSLIKFKINFKTIKKVT